MSIFHISPSPVYSQSADPSSKGDNLDSTTSATSVTPSPQNDGDNKTTEETKSDSSSSNETTKKDETRYVI